MNYKEYENPLHTKEKINVFDLIDVFKSLDKKEQEFFKNSIQSNTHLKISFYINLMDGFLRGKKIQKRAKFSKNDEWFDVDMPTWQFLKFDYRIKEEK